MKRFTVRGTNQGFVCLHCGADVAPLAGGSVRNHCPACLWSLHVDVDPGDRASDCGGPLAPVGAESVGGKGWRIVHRCTVCGAERRNKAALDDPTQPDDYDALIRLTLPVGAQEVPT
ncbi:MAG: RNHCP domain-containing protein [Trueperaceae bacterium]|nr:RNHCP domain-containing protein [Trueperaceae bacterium]